MKHAQFTVYIHIAFSENKMTTLKEGMINKAEKMDFDLSNEDAVSRLKSQDDNSIDLLIIDPPMSNTG
jgi:hypothetical protein